jgi:hypothetical protein
MVLAAAFAPETRSVAEYDPGARALVTKETESFVGAVCDERLT